MFGRVAMGDCDGCRGNVERDELGLPEFVGEGDGDTAAAGVDVGDEYAGTVVLIGTTGAEFAKSEAVERDFDEMLGFGAGNENVGSDFKRKAPEFLFASEVLDRGS